MKGPFDPIVIDPPATVVSEEWSRCSEAVDACGGLTYQDGEVNWRAAFSADPGICTCPNCGINYWAFGNRQRCADCGFEFPVDWWPMYSYGVSAARMHIPADQYAFTAELHAKRMQHQYCRYGYEHPVEDAWKEHDQIKWKDVLAS